MPRFVQRKYGHAWIGCVEMIAPGGVFATLVLSFLYVRERIVMAAKKSSSGGDNLTPRGGSSAYNKNQVMMRRPSVKSFLSFLNSEAKKAGAPGSAAHRKRMDEIVSAIKLSAVSKGESLMPVTAPRMKSYKELKAMRSPNAIAQTQNKRNQAKREAMASIEKMRKSGK